MADSLLQESIRQLQKDWDCQLFEKMESALLEFTQLKVPMENTPLTFQDLQGPKAKADVIGDTEAKGSGDG